MRNYDTTNGLPFVRIRRITADYSPNVPPSISYDEERAMVDSDRKVHSLSEVAVKHTLIVSPGSVETRIGLIDLDTGEPVEGTTSLMDLIMGIGALIRADQLRRDTETLDD